MADKKILVNVDFGGSSSIKGLPSATTASGDYIVITDANDDGKAKKGPSFGANDGTFLRKDGTWAGLGGTTISANATPIVTFKKSASSSGSFIGFKPNNQDNSVWLTGVTSALAYRFSYSSNGGTTVTKKMELDTNGNLEVVGTISEAGTALSSKYLGISSTAADSTKLNGQAASYYLNYNNLSNKPTIPAAQVNSDWNASSGVAKILNKPTLATVATSGSYNDLSNKPTIPSVSNATITVKQSGRSDQTFTLNGSATTINLDNTTYSAGTGLTLTGTQFNVSAANVSTMLNLLSTGSSTPTDADYYISQYVGGGTTTTTYHRRPMSALWAYVKGKADSTYLGKSAKAADSDKLDGQDSTYYLNYDNLTNKPTIPAAQVNADWNASSGVAQILNKPTIPTKDSNLTNDRYVRYDTNAQGLTATQKTNARTNIGAGTSNLTLGNTASTAAAGNHDHDGQYLSTQGGELMSGNVPILTLYNKNTPTGPTFIDFKYNGQDGKQWRIGSEVDDCFYIFNTQNGSSHFDKKFWVEPNGNAWADGDIYEGGTKLSLKYLDISGTAADSTKLNGQAASYYLNYSNLSNKPSAVLYSSQSLTDAQKTQARTNIGAGTSSFTGYSSSNKLTTNYIQNDAGWTTNTGTVIGSGLTANNIVLGNSGVNIKTSSYTVATSSTTWSDSDDTKLPTMKAIANKIASSGGTTKYTHHITASWSNGSGAAYRGGTISFQFEDTTSSSYSQNNVSANTLVSFILTHCGIDGSSGEKSYPVNATLQDRADSAKNCFIASKVINSYSSIYVAGLGMSSSSFGYDPGGVYIWNFLPDGVSVIKIEDIVH